MTDPVPLALAAGAVVVAIAALFFARTLLRLLALVAVVVLAVAVAAEIVVPPAVEQRIADQVRASVSDVSSVEADVGSPPFVTRVLVTGTASEVTIDLRGVRRGPLTVDVVRVELEGVAIDRSALWEQRVAVQDVEAAEVTAELTEEALSSATGASVTLDAGQVVVENGGGRVAVAVAVEGGELVLGPGIGVPLGLAELLPCPVEGEVGAGRLQLRCRAEQVPPALVAALRQPVA